ncbi:MAG: HAMP domain-containing histidine kinase [Bacteroidetes bacterium]|jgi:signal transduction histidine kinase|nr:HAMP domain-containing histidine kinase [Bacteroidota bacterium]
MRTKKGFGQVLSVNLLDTGAKHQHRNPMKHYSHYHKHAITKAKNKSLETAVHKFDIPLNTIMLAADLIGSQYDTLSKQSLLNEVTGIKTAAAYMYAILNDFLAAEKIDKHKIQPVITSFDLKGLTENVVGQMKHQTRDWQDIKYTHIGSSHISLDEKLLEHCLVNLISNAIKYSDVADHIEVGTEINEDSCKIWVKDYGIGIPEKEQDKLFEPFFRASNVSHTTGTGLGLNLVKRYAELMGGKVTVEKNAKKGTVFNLIFPITS